jgi:hypothetical protein
MDGRSTIPSSHFPLSVVVRVTHCDGEELADKGNPYVHVLLGILHTNFRKTDKHQAAIRQSARVLSTRYACVSVFLFVCVPWGKRSASAEALVAAARMSSHIPAKGDLIVNGPMRQASSDLELACDASPLPSRVASSQTTRQREAKALFVSPRL